MALGILLPLFLIISTILGKNTAVLQRLRPSKSIFSISACASSLSSLGNQLKPLSRSRYRKWESSFFIMKCIMSFLICLLQNLQ